MIDSKKKNLRKNHPETKTFFFLFDADCGVSSEMRADLFFRFGCLVHIPPGKLTWHLKIGLPTMKVVSQPSIFRCYISFGEGNF